MKRGAGLATLAVLVLFAVSPAASAKSTVPELGINNPMGPTPVTLYMHLAGYQNFPINTQVPDPGFEFETAGTGSATQSSSCLRQHLQPTSTALLYQEFHSFFGYSSPGYVQYDLIENGAPRFTPERGLGWDVGLASAPFTLYWYLQSQTSLPGQPGSQADPIVAPPLPNVVVTAHLRASDIISSGNVAYNAAPLIAHGRTDPVTIVAGQEVEDNPQVTVFETAGQPTVYEFAIPITIDLPVITKATGYNLRIDVAMDVPTCDEPYGGKFMTNFVRLHSSAEHRPRMELSILEPLRIQALGLYREGPTIDMYVTAHSPWGNYDVDEASLNVTIAGSGGSWTLEPISVLQRLYEHGHHQEPVDAVYSWNTTGHPAGRYTVTATVFNDQHTANATAVAGIILGSNSALYPVSLDDVTQWPDSSGQAMPGPALPAAALLLAVATFLRRRT